jgi:hypothetical protein
VLEDWSVKSNYLFFELGEPVPVGVSLEVDPAEIASTEIIVDGIVVQSIQGAPLTPIDLDWPLGRHSIMVAVFDRNGNRSEHRPRLVLVQDPDPNGIITDQGITARWDEESDRVLILTFSTPDGANCQLQQNNDLTGEWQTEVELTGTGGRVEFPYEVPDGLEGERAHFRVLYSK